MKEGENHYYLLIADFCGFMTQSTIGVGKYDMMNCKGVTEGITSVTAGYKGEIFYYAAGNGVYLYDYKVSNASGDPVWEAPDGETVTCVRLQKYQGTGLMVKVPVNDCEILYIATYNESTGNGTVSWIATHRRFRAAKRSAFVWQLKSAVRFRASATCLTNPQSAYTPETMRVSLTCSRN